MKTLMAAYKQWLKNYVVHPHAYKQQALCLIKKIDEDGTLEDFYTLLTSVNFTTQKKQRFFHSVPSQPKKLPQRMHSTSSLDTPLTNEHPSIVQHEEDIFIAEHSKLLFAVKELIDIDSERLKTTAFTAIEQTARTAPLIALIRGILIDPNWKKHPSSLALLHVLQNQQDLVTILNHLASQDAADTPLTLRRQSFDTLQLPNSCQDYDDCLGLLRSNAATFSYNNNPLFKSADDFLKNVILVYHNLNTPEASEHAHCTIL